MRFNVDHIHFHTGVVFLLSTGPSTTRYRENQHTNIRKLFHLFAGEFLLQMTVLLIFQEELFHPFYTTGYKLEAEAVTQAVICILSKLNFLVRNSLDISNCVIKLT